MEIPEINMIGDFEAGMKVLQNPSLISRFQPFSVVSKVSQVYTFWKWGALFFAIFATLNSLVKRLIKLIFLHFRSIKPQFDQIVSDFTDDDDDDDISLASSSDDEDRIEKEAEESDDDDSTASFDDDFCVKGSFLRLKTHWQNGSFRNRFPSGKNVVKIWDSLALKLDFDEDLINRDSTSVVSIWDFDRETEWIKTNTNGKGIVLTGYDSRMRRRVPALYAEWPTAASGVVMVGDVRNVKVPLQCDGVIAEEEEDDFEKF